MGRKGGFHESKIFFTAAGEAIPDRERRHPCVRRADYRHAVTDDIAAYAGISKGLLFHYFGNKRGLYQYAFDYCLRFIAQAANRAIPEGKMDFFAITLQCEHAKVGIMKRYPHVYAFIMRAYYEEDEDVADLVQPLRLSLIHI